MTEDVKIEEIISRIEKGYYALPDIQRGFVWSSSKIRDLVDSLYRGYTIGMIMVWEKESKDNIETVPISEDISFKKDKWERLVIDGQQRITALYLVTKGEIRKENKTKKLILGFNPVSDEFRVHRSPKQINLPEVEVQKIISQENIYQLISDVIKYVTENSDRSNNEELEKKIPNRILKLKQALTSNKIPIYTIPNNMEYVDVAEIFYRVNSRGTRLKFNELLIALLTLNIPHSFRKDMRKYMNGLADNDWDIDVGVVMKVMNAFATNSISKKEFERLIRSANEKKLKAIWEKTKEYFKTAIEFLETHLNIKSNNIIASPVPLIPLTYYLYKYKHKIPKLIQEKLSAWFLVASLTNRYLGSQESKLTKDIQSIKNESEIGEAIDEMIQRCGPITLDILKGKNAGLLMTLYCLAMRNKAMDWFKAVSINVIKPEKHHIFPVAILRSKFNNEEIDDIGNIALITARANKDINKQEPSKYLENISEDTLKAQFIPMDKRLWHVEKYQEFLIARRKLIFDALRNYVNTVFGKQIIK